MSSENIIIKSNEGTDPRYGKKPSERTVEELLDLGFVIIDKPCGPSSHEVSSWVKKLLKIKKTGHTGTLDPNVSGVLPVALNRATKSVGFLLKSTKEYVGIMQFHKPVTPEKVKELFRQFTGEIQQTPPLRSAVRKVQRKRKVYYLDALEFYNQNVLFHVVCEAGTYIRKLCHDIGKISKLGAHMLELRRIKVSKISEDKSIKLQDLSDVYWAWQEKKNDELAKHIVPIESLLNLKRIWVKDSAVEAVCSGAALAVPGIAKFEENMAKDEEIAILSLKGELVAFAKTMLSSKEIAENKNGMAAKPMRVVMEKGTYPKCW
ncbi:RNA-guided pseudouridylation complex pseudouridine synthase subunit Cbf5 [Candidatus Micrarchaeota archaeon]|nr:RNA-guided pseudouridylation complex pseudouridine synthase subunit Cbf5 [Candidatus Micrarchaeota archaeon]